jgi:hypothetical protein
MSNLNPAGRDRIIGPRVSESQSSRRESGPGTERFYLPPHRTSGSLPGTAGRTRLKR